MTAANRQEFLMTKAGAFTAEAIERLVCERDAALHRAEIAEIALEDLRLYKQTVTKTADLPITSQRPHDAGTPGAAT